MVSLDSSLWIQILNFVLLIFILNILFYKPILGVIDKRKKQLEEADSEIKHLQEEVERKMAAYAEKLREAKAAAIERKNVMINQAAEEAKSAIEEVRAELPEMMEQFRMKVDEEVIAARKILTERSRELSVEIAEKVLGRRLR